MLSPKCQMYGMLKSCQNLDNFVSFPLFSPASLGFTFNPRAFFSAAARS